MDDGRGWLADLRRKALHLRFGPLRPGDLDHAIEGAERAADELLNLRPWLELGQGHWTREPAEVEGQYIWAQPAERHPRMNLYLGATYLERGDTAPGVRWSVPLPAMPPVPEGE